MKKPTQKGRFRAFYSVALSCRKAPPEFRFAPSTLLNFVPSGAAHEAAAGHALAEPSDNYTASAFFIVVCRENKRIDMFVISWFVVGPMWSHRLPLWLF